MCILRVVADLRTQLDKNFDWLPTSEKDDVAAVRPTYNGYSYTPNIHALRDSRFCLKAKRYFGKWRTTLPICTSCCEFSTNTVPAHSDLRELSP